MIRKIWLGNLGFTLAEILVVIAVLTVVGGILTQTFIKSLQGSNKSQVLSLIKQNGQNVLTVIDRNIRNADNVVCPHIPENSTTASGDTLVTEKDGVYTRVRILPANSSGILCSSVSNGQICQDNPTPTDDEKIHFNLLVNRFCNINDPLATVSAALTDTDANNGVSVSPGPPLGTSFTRNREAGFKDTVTINFLIGPSTQAPKFISDQLSQVPFTTTIELR